MQAVLRSVLPAALFAAGALTIASGAALAQTAGAPTAAGPGPVEEDFAVGRFVMMDATPVLPDGKSGNKATMMIDTEFGRSWVLTREAGGRLIWERVWVKKSDTVPDDSLRRPQPVR